jgi:hypothetical protein
MAEDMRGFLRKLKTSRLGRLFGNTNMRWFECQFQERIFGYKDKMTDHKLRSSIKFEEITDFSDRLSLEDAKMCDWNYGFQIITKNRVFILYCQNKDNLEKWKNAFNIILKKQPKKLATIQAPNFNFMKPKEEQKKAEEKPVKIVEKLPINEKSRENEVKVEVKEVKVEEIKREEVVRVYEEKPKSNAEPKKGVIKVDDNEDILVGNYDEITEIKPDRFKKQEYKGEKPQHSTNVIPQLIVKQQVISVKPATLKDEFDDNIENLIYEADKSFDNVVNNNSIINDKYYKHTKKSNARSASAVVVESPGVTSNILKNIMQKEQEKKGKVTLAAKDIHDWNYYDKNGGVVKEEVNAYNPATANEGTKEERENKRKKKAIANLLNKGVHLGLDIEEEEVDTSNLGKSMINDHNRTHLSKQQNFNQMNNQENRNKSILETREKGEVNIIFTEHLKEENKQEAFNPKNILNNIVLYDKHKGSDYPKSPIRIDDKVKILGLAHPEIKRNYIIDERKESENNEEFEEMNLYFVENKQDIYESKYNNKQVNNQSIIDNEPKKPVHIKAFKKLEDDFEDFDYHNQKRTINSIQKTVITKPNSNNSVLQTQNNQQNKNRQIQQNAMSNSIILGNLNGFDSNPDFTNNILKHEEKNSNVVNFQMKKNKQNVNSSFIEDLTDDWNENEIIQKK